MHALRGGGKENRPDAERHIAYAHEGGLVLAQPVSQGCDQNGVGRLMPPPPASVEGTTYPDYVYEYTQSTHHKPLVLRLLVCCCCPFFPIMAPSSSCAQQPDTSPRGLSNGFALPGCTALRMGYLSPPQKVRMHGTGTQRELSHRHSCTKKPLRELLKDGSQRALEHLPHRAPRAGRSCITQGCLGRKVCPAHTQCGNAPSGSSRSASIVSRVQGP